MTQTAERKITPPAEVKTALENLFDVAEGDTGQSRRVANFLLAWWNAEDFGGFDFTDLWNVDFQLARDMVLVFAYVAGHRHYVDALGFGGRIDHVRRLWRRAR